MTTIQQEVVKSVYNYRSITNDQAKNYLKATEEELNQLIKEGYLTENHFEDLTYYFLTTKGVHLAKRLLGLRKTKREAGMSRGYVTASKLAFKTRIARHQLDLAEFMLRFHQQNNDLVLDDFEFLDGGVLKDDIKKHASPDGWISIGGVEFFIEIDRGTERKRAIEEKMGNYKRFLDSDCFRQRPRTVVVLFCCTNNPTEKRKEMIMESMTNALEFYFDKGFHFVLGNMDDNLSILRNSILKNNLTNKKETIRF